MNKQYSRSIALEWSWWTHFWGAEISLFDGDGDRDVKLSFKCGLLAVWLTFEDVLPRSWVPAVDYKLRHSPERNTGITLHSGAIWVDFWNDPSGWSSEQPWWWHFNFNVVDFLLGQHKYSKTNIQTHQNVPLRICPHEEYKATVTMYDATWKRPRWFAKKIRRAEVEVEGGVVHPGKGTESYNCGDDALFSLTTVAESPRQAVKAFVNSVLDCRERYPL